jgi:hypothetical protein
MDIGIFNFLAVLLLLGFLYYFYRTSLNEKQEKKQDELLELQKRYNDEVEALQTLYEKNGVPSIESDILLKKGEVLYAKFSGTWNELRRTTTNVSYGGFSTRIPIMKGLSYRTGSYNLNRETADILTPIDSGDLYITNKAIFFRGGLGNKTLQYNKISHVILGINGFTLERESGKGIFFTCNKPQPNQLVALHLAWHSNRG